MLKGIDITLYSKTQTGEDRFHDPIYEETPVTVHNVLVGEPSAEEITTELQLTGRRLAYTLAIPKGDTHDWTDAKVEFFGQTFRADTVKDRCGDGYESYVAPTRAVAVVETASRKAYDDNSANNTLLKAVSGSRSGATVHEHKRRLKDGRVITVRSYQRKK